VPLPRALLRRVIRNLDVAAENIDNPDPAPGELASEDGDGAQRLAATFRGDADVLRMMDTPPGWPPDGPPRNDED